MLNLQIANIPASKLIVLVEVIVTNATTTLKAKILKFLIHLELPLICSFEISDGCDLLPLVIANIGKLRGYFAVIIAPYTFFLLLGFWLLLSIFFPYR